MAFILWFCTRTLLCSYHFFWVFRLYTALLLCNSCFTYLCSSWTRIFNRFSLLKTKKKNYSTLWVVLLESDIQQTPWKVARIWNVILCSYINNTVTLSIKTQPTGFFLWFRFTLLWFSTVWPNVQDSKNWIPFNHANLSISIESSKILIHFISVVLAFCSNLLISRWQFVNFMEGGRGLEG